MKILYLIESRSTIGGEVRATRNPARLIAEDCGTSKQTSGSFLFLFCMIVRHKRKLERFPLS